MTAMLQKFFLTNLNGGELTMAVLAFLIALYAIFKVSNIQKTVIKRNELESIKKAVEKGFDEIKKDFTEVHRRLWELQGHKKDKS
jgi:hypothetical protein